MPEKPKPEHPRPEVTKPTGPTLPPKIHKPVPRIT